MPRLPTLLALLATAASGAAAQNATPDTLDWRGYFPLAVGNEWEYRVDYVDPADVIDPVDRSRTNYVRYRVVGDGAGPDGDRFALVEDGFSADGVGGLRDTLAVRYDEATASALALIEPESGEAYEWPHPRFAADLDLPLGWPPDDERLTLFYTAAQRFEDGGPLPIPPAVPDSVDLNRTKWFYNLVYGFTSVHGIGFVAGGGGCEPCDGFSSYESWTLTYARVGGVTYGERAVAGEAPPVAASELRLFPNPAVAWVTVEGEGDRAEVYDLLGRRVREAAAPRSGPLRLDLGGLAPGAYVVRRGGAAAVVTVR